MRRMIVLILFIFLIPTTLRAAGEVDLLWQGGTYTPPFYEGLPLWSNQSRITFTAISNLPASSNPYYRWTKNGTVLGSMSGLGKKSIMFIDSILSLPIEVKIDLRDGEDGKVLGTASVTLNPIAPRLLILENNPLYGLMLNKAVGSEFPLSENEVTFSAFPLFSAVSTRFAPAFTYTWRTNDGDSRDGNSVTYRAPDSGSGSASVNLKAAHSIILAQPENKSFLIKFSNQNAF